MVKPDEAIGRGVRWMIEDSKKIIDVLIRCFKMAVSLLEALKREG